MSCSCESYNMFNRYWWNSSFFRHGTWHTWRGIRKMLQDTFPQILCWIIGHIPYDCSDNKDKSEWACDRCRQYIKLEGLNEHKRD